MKECRENNSVCTWLMLTFIRHGRQTNVKYKETEIRTRNAHLRPPGHATECYNHSNLIAKWLNTIFLYYCIITLDSEKKC